MRNRLRSWSKYVESICLLHRPAIDAEEHRRKITTHRIMQVFHLCRDALSSTGSCSIRFFLFVGCVQHNEGVLNAVRVNAIDTISGVFHTPYFSVWLCSELLTNNAFYGRMEGECRLLYCVTNCLIPFAMARPTRGVSPSRNLGMMLRTPKLEK